MKQQRIQLPDNCCIIIRDLCATPQEVKAVFQLPLTQGQDILDGNDVLVTQKQLDVVQSICANELSYAFQRRVAALLHDPRTRDSFVVWVNTSAAMLDMFRSMKAIVGQCAFVNPLDPFLSGMFHMAASMDEVAGFLERLHQKFPQFDGLFFRGTRFLGEQQDVTPPPVSRVPSSVDVLSLSPEDERIYQLYKEQQ